MNLRIIAFIILSVASATAGTNRVHNSSFECGASGWYTSHSTNFDTWGNDKPNSMHIVSTNGVGQHGVSAVYWATRLWSRPFWLTNGTYVLSFKARSASANVIHAGVVGIPEIVLDPTNATYNTTTTYNITTSWATYSTTFQVATSLFFSVKMYQPNNQVICWVDEVQVELGSTATTYAPASPLEVGMDTADYANVLFLADTKQLRFRLYNNGAQTNVTVHYDIFNLWNTNAARGDVTTNALAATSGTTINLNLPPMWGNLRATCYITNLHETWSETSVAVLPFAAQSGRDTNGILGLHTQWSPYHLVDARRVGFTHDRIFSPTTDARWEQVFLTLTTTNMLPPGNWRLDNVMATHATNDMIPIVVLTGIDKGWYPQTNASWTVMLGDYTNYVGRVVHRYSQAPYDAHIFEVWNEPQQEDRATVALYNPAIYADLYTNTARLIKTIDPQSTVIALGGSSSANQGTNMWNRFTPQGKTDADVVSVHFYPQPGGYPDPNLSDEMSQFSTANYSDWFREFRGVKPTWNTETGTYDAGGYHTIAVAFTYPFYWVEFKTNVFTPGTPNEAWFNETEGRQVGTTDRITINFCRSIGWGMTHFNTQYGRKPDEAVMANATPTIYELNHTLKPWAVALVIANHFIRTPGLGQITNVNETVFVECYGHTNSLGAVVTAWCPDRGNRTLTVTNGSFALYDTMGNQVQTNSLTVRLGRSVRYLVSGTLTYAQMAATIASATVATNQDTSAPGISIDFSPIGTTTAWGGVSNWFKATALDETVMQFSTGTPTSTATNVQYRWTREEAGFVSPWSATNHFAYSYPVAGNYRVGWQAKDVAGNLTPWTYTPYFGDLTMQPFTAFPDPTGLRLNIGGARLRVIQRP